MLSSSSILFYYHRYNKPHPHTHTHTHTCCICARIYTHTSHHLSPPHPWPALTPAVDLNWVGGWVRQQHRFIMLIAAHTSTWINIIIIIYMHWGRLNHMHGKIICVYILQRLDKKHFNAFACTHLHRFADASSSKYRQQYIVLMHLNEKGALMRQISCLYPQTGNAMHLYHSSCVFHFLWNNLI